jgi:hypothetical protein
MFTEVGKVRPKANNLNDSLRISAFIPNIVIEHYKTAFADSFNLSSTEYPVQVCFISTACLSCPVFSGLLVKILLASSFIVVMLKTFSFCDFLVFRPLSLFVLSLLTPFPRNFFLQRPLNGTVLLVDISGFTKLNVYLNETKGRLGPEASCSDHLFLHCFALPCFYFTA